MRNYEKGLLFVMYFNDFIISKPSPHPPCSLCILGEPYVTAQPDFVVDNDDIFVVVVEVCIFDRLEILIFVDSDNFLLTG